MDQILLAKSTRDPTPRFEETLLGHTQKVLESFRLIFGQSSEEPTRLTRKWLPFFKLEQDDFVSFHANGIAACCLHDLGKANSGFQNMVSRRNGIQAIYHEHLSGLFLWVHPVEDWIEALPHADRTIVFGAVTGHHLRVASKEFAQPLHTDVKRFRVFSDEILEMLGRFAEELRIPFVSDKRIEPVWSFDGKSGFDTDELSDRLRKTLRLCNRAIKNDTRLNRLIMAVRTGLILADSSGSAIVRERKDIEQWLNGAFGPHLDGSYIDDQVIKRRVAQIKRSKGKFVWSDFQNAAENFSRRALLLAPCGSGKTLAAWRWIKARLDERPASRVIFLYPTKAAATEGFRDYVAWAPEADAGLVTGTSAYELEGMFENAEDERSGKNFSTEDRLYALGLWHRRVFSATVDQFLGFMQQIYRSVCLMPLLADSIIVFDEVHSFDRGLFSALKLFLKNFDVPVLCMTASLPPLRRDDLEDCGLEVFPKTIEAFPELQTGAAMPRYRIIRTDGEDSAANIAFAALEDGKRVLWVVNTVARCQQLVRKVDGLGALCYHSRFKLEDRKDRHEAVITAFQESNCPVLAITTQVCEMSLDLDADVLISEMAPITSMIQRLGRCNRHARPGEGKLGEVYFYSPEDERPYSIGDLTGCEDFIGELDGKVANQQFLEELLEKYGPADIEFERYSAFLEDGIWASTRELRDANDSTINVLLETDLPDYFSLLKEGKSVDGLFLPVPRRFAKPHPKLGRFPQVAKSSHYHKEYGFFDHPLEGVI
ncbi:MAG: CRISPR-associated helicase Cas3' [Syntrophobacteraceae bacterium]